MFTTSEPATRTLPPAGAVAAVALAGPLLIVAGQLLLRTGGPWLAAHLIFFAGLLAILPAYDAIDRLRGGRTLSGWASVGRFFVLGGSILTAGQFAIDLAADVAARGDVAARSDWMDSVLGHNTAFDAVFYLIAPNLLFVGILLVAIGWLRATQDRLPRSSAGMVIGGVLVFAVGYLAEIPLFTRGGLVLLGLGFIATVVAAMDRQPKQPVLYGMSAS